MATPFLDTFVNPPDQDGYGYNPGRSFVEVMLEGGQARMRRDVLGMVHYVTCKFSCNPQQYTHLMGFFRERIEGHTKIFRINLLIDVPAIVPYRAQITGDPPSLVSVQGLLHIVQARFAVLPNPIKGFSLFLNNSSTPIMVDAGTADYAGELDQFPVGRSVILTGTRQVVDGVEINLDSPYNSSSRLYTPYTMNTAPNAFTRTLLNAATINPGWTALAATIPQQYNPLSGAAILVPL